jgi:hypothetical protein
MNYIVRMSPESNPIELTPEEFESRIRSGAIPVSAELEGGDSWIRMDDLPTFHRLSPVDLPPGPRMLDRLRAAMLVRRQHQKRDRLRASYKSVLIQRFALQSVQSLASKNEAAVISRCTFDPSFEPECVLTLIFKENDIIAQAHWSPKSLWYSLPNEPLDADELPTERDFEEFVRANKSKYQHNTFGIPINPEMQFDPSRVILRCERFDEGRLQQIFMPSTEFHMRALEATECYAENVRDGISYEHELFSKGAYLKVRWGNPEAGGYQKQATLAAAYERLYYEMTKSLRS